MEEPLRTKIEDKKVLLKSPIGPPPSKKLKQARLPFAPKQANSPPAPLASKKRKLSDGSKNDKQPTKQAKSDENTGEKEIIVIEDNEVSSSSEAEKTRDKHGKQDKPKSKTIKDMFAGLGQPEVSTSSASPESSGVKCDENEDEKMVCDDVDDSKMDSKETFETVDSETEKKVHSEKENIKESSDEKETSEAAEKPAENVDEESSSSNEDKENVSLLSITGADTSVLETSDVEDEDSGAEADTSVTEGTDAKDSTGANTPSSANNPRKSVMSEKKKAEREAAKQRRRDELEKEKEAKLAEKQKQKEERIKQKQEEKEKKEQEKQALKEQKQKERQEKLEQKEKEKEAKNKVKEEEKKKKLEVVEAKMEEKKKKDEEKRKKEEEKKQAEEEEKMKKKKVKQAFVSFFKKVDKPAVPSKSLQKTNELFMQFEPKKDMRLAPVIRHTLPDVDRMSLDKEMEEQTCKMLYIEQLRAKELKPGRNGRTWEWEDDDLEVLDDQESAQTKKMKAKFLYFHANYRPPYYGTWRKKSSRIRPRKPLGQDTVLLDYEVDSDDEWEEEEPGESLSNSEGEDEEDNNKEDKDDDEDEDGFFVPHGYLSEGEGCEDEGDDECTPERMKARQLAKAKAFEVEMKQKCQALRAFFIGCMWWTPEGSTDPNYKKLAEFTAVSLFPSGAIEVRSSSNKSSGSQDTSPSTSNKMKTPKEVGETTRGAVRKSVPDEAMADLVRLVHGNRASIQKLIREFREYWSKKTNDQDPVSSTSLADISLDNVEAMDTSLNNPSEGNTSICTPGTSEGQKCSISKRQLDITIRSISNYCKKEGFHMKCWYVNDDILKKHSLTDLPVPTEWVWLTRNNVKRSEDEPSTPSTPSGRDTPTQASTPNPTNSIVKFAVPTSQLPSPQVELGTPRSRDCVSPSPQSTTPKTQEKLTPRNLMSIKSAFAAIPKAKQVGSNTTNTNKEEGQPDKAEEKKDNKTVDDDCMIVDDEASGKKDTATVEKDCMIIDNNKTEDTKKEPKTSGNPGKSS